VDVENTIVSIKEISQLINRFFLNLQKQLAMTTIENTKETLEKQFQELYEKAKKLYPNIDEAINSINNITAKTNDLQDFLNLSTQQPRETSSNHISLI
jgi:hypothetical protein